ncbi:hypothetical protein BDQ94DRAFT_163980 [Aspergillus welwitschiae]|uniref:Beta-lactamase-like protein n=1 Tax=Aspergillus welwitschiae TaxID=1341132 RepID=A0A3F3PL21_9EURO|nr:hypothetical protein BDQ94DRAFT_163980 [Aspergillus welwitschiae]RDH27036.1 hypothetical protein BDQ94DRAFT_163980 [Aspergillus welwitschiae]
MTPSGFQSTVTITHISTATAIINIDGIKILTDPYFSPAGTLADLSHIDGVLLSHENHDNNLDILDYRILNGRHVLIIKDSAKNLAPRPDIRGLDSWESVILVLENKEFTVTRILYRYIPGQEYTGFAIILESFGVSSDGLLNTIWFSGDTVYFNKLKDIRNHWYITAAILNLGYVHAPGKILQITQPDSSSTDGPIQITMDSKEGACIFHELGADILELKVVMEAKGLCNKMCWLAPGVFKRIF